MDNEGMLLIQLFLLWLLYCTLGTYCRCWCCLYWVFYQQNKPLTWVDAGCFTNKMSLTWVGINMQMDNEQMLSIKLLQSICKSTMSECYLFNCCYYVSMMKPLWFYHVLQRNLWSTFHVSRRNFWSFITWLSTPGLLSQTNFLLGPTFYLTILSLMA